MILKIYLLPFLSIEILTHGWTLVMNTCNTAFELGASLGYRASPCLKSAKNVPLRSAFYYLHKGVGKLQITECLEEYVIYSDINI